MIWALLGLTLTLAALVYPAWRGTRPARNSAPPQDKPVLVCLGDSLTHGRVGADWVADLRAKHPDWHIHNAGINGQVAWELTQRVDEVLALKPAAVVVLIGCNDVMASLSAEDGERYRRDNELPQVPDLAWYRESLATLLGRLEGVPTAVMTLAPLGEDGVDHVAPYNEVIRDLAPRVLPLDERLAAIARPGPGHILGPKRRHVVYQALVRHYLLLRSWDQVAEDRGAWLLVDGIHFADRAAAVVAQLVEDFFAEVLRSS